MMPHRRALRLHQIVTRRGPPPSPRSYTPPPSSVPWRARSFSASGAPSPVGSAAKRVLQVGLSTALTGGLGAAGYVYSQVGDDPEGFARSVYFYRRAIPKYFAYRRQQRRTERLERELRRREETPGDADASERLRRELEEAEREWEEMHRKTSALGLETILALRGFYIKAGQMGAANIGNAFPPIWRDALSVLQDGVPPKGYDVVRDVVREEYREALGREADEVFLSFDPVPIGAASIGQVHRATVRDENTGEAAPVVVKVMYPEVERLFRGDVRTMKMFCQVAQPVHVASLEEVERQFMTEFDYKKEASQLERVRQNLVRAGIAPESNRGDNGAYLCAVPRPYLHLCTKRVLVMEELHGIKLLDGLKADVARHYSDGTTKGAHDKMVQALKTHATAEDERSTEEFLPERIGPTKKQYELYIAAADVKRRSTNFYHALYNWTVGMLPGIPKKKIQDRATLPLNHAAIVDKLFEVHGHEILVDGYFNGDPHPGNILLMNQKKGTCPPLLGLIDYGQVKELSRADRLFLCRLTIALADDDRPEILRLMHASGFRSKNSDKDVMYKYCKIYFDQDGASVTGGKHLQAFIEELERLDPVEHIPPQLIMVHRATILLRGLAHALFQTRSVANVWRPIAEKVLREEGIVYPPPRESGSKE